MTAQALEITGEMLIKKEICLSNQHSGAPHDWHGRGTVHSQKRVDMDGAGLKTIIAYIAVTL